MTTTRTTSTRQRHAQFQKGLGVYTCRCCTRQTRGDGADSAGVELCPECYTLAGEENHLSDHGTFYDRPENIITLINAVAEKGGAVGVWAHIQTKAEKLVMAALPTAVVPVEAPAKPTKAPRKAAKAAEAAIVVDTALADALARVAMLETLLRDTQRIGFIVVHSELDNRINAALAKA